ncbi:hypothetical protein AB0A95_30535 [Micromonospora sp. NPDC049230]|uniref:hypothetical protein n=1 Tax=Micromonospora sp. NPDC049230 TaxID=3155502 RepID=UPI0033E43489
MGRPSALVFVVHVAGEPGDDHVQRCVPCGAVLHDGRPWFEGRVAVPVGSGPDYPSWWPPGALVATDKPHDGTGGGMTYTIDDRALDDDEGPCTPAS